MNKLRELLDAYVCGETTEYRLEQWLSLRADDIAKLIDAARKLDANLKRYSNDTGSILWPDTAKELGDALAKLEE